MGMSDAIAVRVALEAVTPLFRAFLWSDLPGAVAVSLTRASGSTQESIYSSELNGKLAPVEVSYRRAHGRIHYTLKEAFSVQSTERVLCLDANGRKQSVPHRIPVRECGDEPCSDSTMLKRCARYPARLEQGECSGTPLRAGPKATDVSP